MPTASAEVQARKIVLCVTGGIAAYKVAYVVRSLSQLGADVRVAMTQSAARFVGEQTFATLTGNPVGVDLYGPGGDVPHVELARNADLVIVAPATANIIAKMAAGMADDLVSATLLTASCPVLIAPAMHTEMWEHPATKANMTTLTARGVTFVGPGEGPLSSGDRGPGRMAEPDDIVESAATLLGQSRVLADRRVLVTAGGTQEPIDPVRFIGNRSSGRMGFAIARAAARRGAKVSLVAGPTELPAPPGVDLVPVKTAAEMREAVLERAPVADIIVKAAAVADFRPEVAAGRKLKKAAGPPQVVLVPNPDILAELGGGLAPRKDGGVLVGFAAETEPDPARLAEVAEEKRRAKGADLIVANDVSSPDSGFNVRTNRAVIAGPAGVQDLGLVSKDALAEAILDAVAPLLSPDPEAGN
jgi:phosphopantothenoylcysteine decarboxylase / phosphopantothenate---cysteine ligase